jgi:glyoxylase-like metal-dependent hydrolase (beta-lactamase superfamily II)
VGTLRASIDLFGDGSCLIVDAHGRTEGGLGVLLRLRNHAVFLADSLAPVEETLRYVATPTSLSDAEFWWGEIWRLKKFKDLEPALRVVPGHSDEELRNIRAKEVVVHDYETTSLTPSTDEGSPRPPMAN